MSNNQIIHIIFGYKMHICAPSVFILFTLKSQKKKKDVKIHVCIYTHTYTLLIYSWMLLSHKKNGIMTSVATWMDLEMIILSKISQRERQIPCDITWMWNLKYDTNERICETEINSQIQRTDFLPRKRGGGAGKNWEFRISRCKLLYIT